jgi:hypothetical protein
MDSATKDTATRIIEVNGVKLEVDLRSARQISCFRVGDRVKVLTKKWDSTYRSCAGAIVAIDAFQALPTIVVAFIDNPLASDGKIEFAYINSQSKDIEICAMSEDDIVPTRQTILTFFNAAIEKKEQEIAEIRTRKEYFLRQYGTAFGTPIPSEPTPS